VYVLLNSDLFLDHEQTICKSCFYVFSAANLFVSKLSLDSIWCLSDIELSARQWLCWPHYNVSTTLLIHLTLFRLFKWKSNWCWSMHRLYACWFGVSCFVQTFMSIFVFWFSLCNCIITGFHVLSSIDSCVLCWLSWTLVVSFSQLVYNNWFPTLTFLCSNSCACWSLLSCILLLCTTLVVSCCATMNPAHSGFNVSFPAIVHCSCFWLHLYSFIDDSILVLS